MTYRYVPQRWRLAAQLVTLAGTSALGASIVATPPQTDVKLSQIEQTMNADLWGWLLVAAGAIGFLAEGVMSSTKTMKLFWVVSMCHIVCLSLMVAYGTSALVGLIERGQWYNFAGPVLAVMVGTWHLVYVQRKPSIPADLVDWRRQRPLADGIP